MAALNTQPAPMVRMFHVQAALGVCETVVQRLVKEGKLPTPDAGGARKAVCWKLSTIYRWNPDLGDAIAPLLKMPLLKLPSKLAA